VRPRGSVAVVGATATLIALIIAGVGAAPTAFASAPQPVPDGIYVDGASWGAPGDRVWVGVTFSAGCIGSPEATFHGDDTPLVLDADGFGEDDWRDEYGFDIPLTATGTGSLVVTCSSTGSTPITVSIPFTVSAIEPASTYHSASMWSLLGPDSSRTWTLNKVGFIPQEPVTVTFYDQTQRDVNSDVTQDMTDPVTVIADGEGAITAQVVAPAGWGADNVDAILSSASSHLVLDTEFADAIPTSNETFTSAATMVNAGDSVAVAGTGYAAGESVVVALHFATEPALVLATLVADGSGAISGSIAIPSNAPPGIFRLWAGSKTVSYLLQNVPLIVSPAGSGTFSDVIVGSPFYSYIEWMSSSGISTGTPEPPAKPIYKPTDAVSRQAMAVFMYRLSGATFTPPGTPTFADVDSSSPFYTAIEWMASTGISTGTPQPPAKPLFKPADPVSRQAMALFLARYAHVDTSTPPTSQSFADVPITASAAAAIGWMASAGISTGTAQPSGLPVYLPANPVSRQAMAAFLYRLAHLPPS